MTIENERSQPHSLEAERAVLGAILIHNDVFDEASDVVQSEDFFRAAHQRLFETMRKLHSQREPIDLTTLREALKARGLYDEVGGAAYITALVDGTPRSTNVAHYGAIIHRYARLRRIIWAGNQMVRAAYEAEDDAAAIIDRAEQALYDLGQEKQAGGFVRVGDLLPTVLTQIERWSESRHGVSGIPSGFPVLDGLTCGFQPGNLIIIGGRPGLGKSALALNIAQYAARQGHPSGYFSLEMSKEELAVRAVTAEARVDGYRLQRGWIRSESADWTRLARAFEDLSKLPLYFDDAPFVSAVDVRSKARRFKTKHRLALLVVDYTQLMVADERRDNRALELAAVTRALKALAKDLSIPIIALSQLNRESDKQGGRRPRLSDLRESGSLEQDSDLVLLIHREDEDSQDRDSQAEIIVAKHRNGPTGVVKLGWRGEESRFVNLDESQGDRRQGEPDRRLPIGDR